jgi:hypothetical protein
MPSSEISLPVLVAVANMLAMVFLDSQSTNYDPRNDLRFAHHVQHPVQEQGRPVPKQRLEQRSFLIQSEGRQSRFELCATRFFLFPAKLIEAENPIRSRPLPKRNVKTYACGPISASPSSIQKKLSASNSVVISAQE